MVISHYSSDILPDLISVDGVQKFPSDLKWSEALISAAERVEAAFGNVKMKCLKVVATYPQLCDSLEIGRNIRSFIAETIQSEL